jgi:hypothetical protein
MNNGIQKQMLFHRPKKHLKKNLSVDPISNVIRASILAKIESIHERI